jgi:uncharacterized protein YkwD
MSFRRLRIVGALALCSAAVAAPAARSAAVGDCTPSADWGSARADLAAQVLVLVNEHRASLGLGALTGSATLEGAAVWKALHMAGNGYFAHDDQAPPVARTVGERLAACGYSGGGWGENIAWGYATAEAVMDGWLNSAGHRSNIENAGYRAIGIGVAAAADGRLYWVQDFGTEAGAAAPEPRAPSPRDDPVSGDASRQELSLAVAAGRPRAGRRFAAFLTLAGGGVDRVSCRATVRGRRLRVAWSGIADGRAACVWRIPRRSGGARLEATIGVRTGDRTVSTAFSRTIR